MGEYIFTIGDKEYKVDVKSIEAGIATVVIDGKEVGISIKQLGKRADTPVVRKPAKKAERTAVQQVPVAPAVQAVPHSSGGKLVRAPIPGVILKVLIKEGDTVKAGQDIIVMEAMKMENQIQTSVSGVVSKINVAVDQSVQQDEVLLEIDPS
ncbi:MAG TPA: biotin/lipoyl-binding protein [candidate division Zixibacteria bacterium]|nr:biotin/lipoyl-binding protein [candidate division Zixibacteria bacterium]